MTASKQGEPADTIDKVPATQRPKTLLQRLSSGLIHAAPSFRTSTPKNDLLSRPSTPISAEDWSRRGGIVVTNELFLVSQLEATTKDGSEQPCPYNPTSYHSSASIEKRPCSFCGMRGPKILQNEPCIACRTGGAGSHISSDRKQTHHDRQHSAVDAHHLAYLADSSSSILLGPRPVTPERAAKRIGNPPRISSLPPGIVRLPAVNSVYANQDRNAFERPPSRLGATCYSSRTPNVLPQSSDKEELPRKPVSPKLHHIHGLSNSENFSLVHKHEISKHAVALRAGSASPLTDRGNSPRSSRDVHAPVDFSDTVYYGGKRSPFSVGHAATQKPHVTTVLANELQTSEGATVDLAPDTSRVYNKSSPQKQKPPQSTQRFGNASDGGITIGNQDRTSTNLGNVRLELKGGYASSHAIPRLRGGSAHENPSTNTLSFKLNRWLLTCHGPCPDDFDTDSDADLPPARVVSPQRVARTRQNMNGRASLPSHISRQGQGQTLAPPTTRSPPPPLATLPIPPTTAFTTTISGPPIPKRHSSCRLSALNFPSVYPRRPDSPINQPCPITQAQFLNPPIPHLRGGAGLPSPSVDPADKIPPTIFYLAGGTRKPITFRGWAQNRPKKRSGGLLGMAVFGRRYGREYEGDRNVLCEVGVAVEVQGEGGGGGEFVERGGDASTKGSSSMSFSSGVKPMPDGTASANAAPAAVAGGVTRALKPQPVEHAEEVPLCSGALPVDPPVDLPVDSTSHSSPGHTDDVTTGAPKKRTA